MERFERWVNNLDIFLMNVAKYLEWIGIFGILAMFFINFIDVIGAKLFLWPFPGATEVIGFSQVVAIAPAITITLLLGRHIRVEFIISRFPKRTQAIISVISSFLSFSLFILLFWQSILYGSSLKEAGEIGSTSRLPFYPFAYLIALASIPVSIAFLAEMLKSLLEAIKDGSG